MPVSIPLDCQPVRRRTGSRFLCRAVSLDAGNASEGGIGKNCGHTDGEIRDRRRLTTDYGDFDISAQNSSVTVLAPASAIELRAQDSIAPPGRAAIVSMLLSVALLVAVSIQLRSLDAAQLKELVPSSPLFWAVFAASYLVLPASEWLIFRRLWKIPASGFAALMRKLVYNELLLGYLGEAVFYRWARRRVEMTAAPFGAIKDVAILSALAGNAVTLLLLVVLWPLVGSTKLGIESRPLIWSLGAVLAISIVTMFFHKRIFSLGRKDLSFILRMHLFRIGSKTGLSALVWHIVLPGVPILWWLFLATIRLLVSRLPFVPNKDVVFAGLAIFALGKDVEIASLMALTAGLTLATHIIVAAGLAIANLANRGEAP